MFRKILDTEQRLLKQCLATHDCSDDVRSAFTAKHHDLNFVVLIDESTSEMVRFRIWKKEPIATITHILSSGKSLSAALDVMQGSGIRCFYRIELGEGLDIPHYTRYVEYSGGPAAPLYVDILGGRPYTDSMEIHSFIK